MQNYSATTIKGVFRSGTSGLVLSEPSKKYFPKAFQEGSRLTYYASKWNSIEINSSFYKMPRCQTYSSWSLQVPEEFQFSIKLWKGITHNNTFGFQMQELESFFLALDCLKKKKGCLLIQFPAGSTMDLSEFRNLLNQIKKIDPGESWRLAIEFRHRRWYKKEVYKTIGEFGASLVLHDMPDSSVAELQGNPRFVYLRFHGETGDYRGTYSEEFLRKKSAEIRQWMNQGLDVYVYFNNTIGGAAGNLATLNEMIRAV